MAHLVALRLQGDDHTKDIDFSARGMRARREAGHADSTSPIARTLWCEPADSLEGVIEHH